MTDALAPAGARPPSAVPHIVDELIEERAGVLGRHPAVWRAVRLVLDPLLGYADARVMADRLASLSGREAVAFMQSRLTLKVAVEGVDRLPAEGPVVLVANHPGGIADGVAVWPALAERRADLCFFANRDALRVCPGLDDLVIPVEWRAHLRNTAKTKQTLRAAASAFGAGRAVTIFPAGRMAQWRWSKRGLVEPAWAATPVSFARKYGCPIVPIGINARMTLVYYAFAQISDALRNLTLFHELVRKTGARYRIRVGEPVDPARLARDETAAIATLRSISEALAWDAE